MHELSSCPSAQFLPPPFSWGGIFLVVNKATNMYLNRGEKGDGDIKDEAFNSAMEREFGSKSFHSTWRAKFGEAKEGLGTVVG